MTVSSSSDMTDKEIINDYKENYTKVRKLLDEESKNDPENEPYLSKYKAKEILGIMGRSLEQAQQRQKNLTIDSLKFDAMMGNIFLHIGYIDMETEELTSSEKFFSDAVELLTPHNIKPEIVSILLKVYNNLGILWFNRDEPEKAKSFLLKAKDLYEAFKQSEAIPIPIEKILTDTDADPNDHKALEKVYTLTLYYLAQVYGALKQNLKSGMYCHITLKRQLQHTDFDAIDWALNAATLSQFFAELHHFTQARHHLAAASCVLDEYEKSLELMRQSPEYNEEQHLAQIETFNHRSADVARCWAKYCLILMTASKARLMNDDTEDTTTKLSDMAVGEENEELICEMNELVFPNMDTAKYEEKIVDKFLLTYEDAREVFLSCQNWLNKAKEYYKLDSLASDYIQLIQDSSQAYHYLAFFEEDDDRRAKMHKRRADMLEDVIMEINPTYYMQYCRQIWYELGEVYSEMLNIKLEIQNKTTEKPTPHALKKINMLCEKSIENYDHFLSSVKDKNGKLPDKLEPDMIRPVVNSYAFIGRNSMKRIAVDKKVQLAHAKKSYDCYKAVVDICERDENAANQMREEYSLCSEMVKILPIKILKLENELGIPPTPL